MNLVIDIGNNYFKLGVFENSDLKYSFTEENSKIAPKIESILIENKNLSHVLISNVSSLSLSNIFENYNIKILKLDSSFVLPFKLNYQTPETLGNDRLALAAAGSVLYPNTNKLIIDVGTCITIDFVDDQNNFLGGSISPGIDMRYKSLNNYTANLPLLQMDDHFSFPGGSTSSSIHSGVLSGVCDEIIGVINKINSQFDNVKVILTGGNAKFLSKRLKITIFANQNFILEGLNSILNLNKD